MSDTITVAGLVERTRRWLFGFHGVPLNTLTTAVDDDDVELALGYDLGTLTAGNYVGIGDELVYVWETDRGAKTAIVSRGQLGTEAVAHAEQAVIEPFSRFPRAAIKDALQDEIRSWPDTVFAVGSTTLTLPADTGAIDLGVRSDGILNVLNVQRSPMVETWWLATRWTDVPSRIDRQMPRDVFPSGVALSLYAKSPQVSTLRVLYSRPFSVDEVDDELDVTEDWGLHRTMADIPPLGAAARLLMAREIQRSDTEAQGESRVAAEVPATYQTQTANALRKLADKRLSDEGVRLRNRYRMPT